MPVWPDVDQLVNLGRGVGHLLVADVSVPDCTSERGVPEDVIVEQNPEQTPNDPAGFFLGEWLYRYRLRLDNHVDEG